MHTPEQVKALKEARLDYGLAGLKVADPAIEEEPLFKVPIVVLLPEDHPLAGQERVPLAELREAPFLLLSRETLPPSTRPSWRSSAGQASPPGWCGRSPASPRR
jgi:DNA-binding transcriptional LysR family regulator